MEATLDQSCSEVDAQATQSGHAPESVTPQTNTTTRTPIEESHLSSSTTTILLNASEFTSNTPTDHTELRELSALVIATFQRSDMEEAKAVYQKMAEVDVNAAEDTLSGAQELQRLMFHWNSTSQQPLKRNHQDRRTSSSSDDGDQYAREKSRLKSDHPVSGNTFCSSDAEARFENSSAPSAAENAAAIVSEGTPAT
jgi:hypothetical protein